jgi:uncharacterized protein
VATQRPAPSDVAFTSAVKAVQTRKGSRNAYARMEQGSGWETEITAELAAFLGEQNSFLLATANAEGQPYVQHRGGPPGFLRVLDTTTWALPTSAGTGSTSASETWPRTRRCTCC